MSPFIVVNAPRIAGWPYAWPVPPVTVDEVLSSASGAQSVLFAAVDELERRYGSSDETFHFVNTELLPPTGFFLLARDDGHLLGGVGVRAIGEASTHLGEVKRLWVRPDARRTGVAELLMREVVNVARTKGFTQLYLETGPAQPEAVALYHKLQWTPVEEFPEGAFTHPSAFRFTRVLL